MSMDCHTNSIFRAPDFKGTECSITTLPYYRSQSVSHLVVHGAAGPAADLQHGRQGHQVLRAARMYATAGIKNVSKQCSWTLLAISSEGKDEMYRN